MSDAASSQLLQEIESKRHAAKGVWRWPPLIGAVLLACGLYMSWPAAGLIGIAALSAMLSYVLYRREAVNRRVTLIYELDASVAAAYEHLRVCAQGLMSGGRLWHVQAEKMTSDATPKKVPYRSPTTVSITEEGPPPVRANLALAAIAVGRQVLWFMPDRMLIDDGKHVGAIAYAELRCRADRVTVYEEEVPPQGAKILRSWYRYATKDGSPDLRYNHNPKTYVCEYEEFSFESSSGLNERLMVSHIGPGRQFVAAVLALTAALSGSVVPEEPATEAPPTKKPITPMDVLRFMTAKLSEYGLPSEPLTVNRYQLRSRFEVKPRVTLVSEKLETIRQRVQQEFGALHVNWFRVLPGNALGLEIPNAALRSLGDPEQLEWLTSDSPNWGEDIQEPLVRMSLRIEKELAAHGCAAQVVSVQFGAGLVRFEIRPKEDIKTVVKYAKDIVEILKARTVVPIPPTDTLFLELSYSNLATQTVPRISGEPCEGGQSAEGEHDPLYSDAVRIVTETRKVSISGVQRRLKIGYNRAARMIESMEAAGLVGPLQSDGSRDVLTPEPPKH